MEYQDSSEKKKLPTEFLNQDGNTAQTSVRKESTDLSVHESNPADLTITEHLQFANNLNKKVFEPIVPKIVEQANKLFSLQGVTDSAYDIESIERTAQVLQKLSSFMEYVISAQMQVLMTLSKFSYCTQRVFIYLIYQGFCGEEEEDDKEDDGNRGDQDQEAGGTGMGEGKGGQENITD
jgi:hypothetical protein